MNTIYIESNCKDKLALEVYFSKLLVWVICIFFLRPLPKYPEKQLSLSNIFFSFSLFNLTIPQWNICLYAFLILCLFENLFNTNDINNAYLSQGNNKKYMMQFRKKNVFRTIFSTNWDANVFVIMMINGNIIFPNKIRFSS